MNASIDLPYCGRPPAPEDLHLAWNMDWRLWLGLAVFAGAIVFVHRRKTFVLGWLALVVAFVSPLCALTVSLFAARSVHHMWLVVLAAPLLGIALPWLGKKIASAGSLIALLVLLGLWHVPAIYSLAWSSHGIYWLLQAGLLLSATMFWSRIFHVLNDAHQPVANELLGALAQIAALVGFMGLIGAVLTFAPQVLFVEHGLAPLFYGLEPLEDQQLAGLLMWVPGFVPLIGVAAYLAVREWKRAAVQRSEVAAP